MAMIDRFNEFAARFGGSMVRGSAPLVSVVKLNGAIGMSSGIGRRSLNLASLEMPLRRAFGKRGVSAVALQINSPGGSPVQSALIAGRIRQLSEEKEIPVYAFTEDVAASGGYWLACSADEIYADPMSIVGSVGVIAATFGFPDLLEKIGVERRVYAQGDNKSMLDPFKAENPDDVTRLLELQKDIHGQFKAYVKARRGDKLKGADKTLFNGDVWTGERAIKKGLVDGLGEMRSVLREKLGEKVRFMPVQRPGGWLQRRFGGADMLATHNWSSDLLAVAEERALWARFGL
ncbi:MAG: S49 family peptidase [Rhodospirillaceae bacterium]|jgi:signal peptide peptidase SppA|nr:S49 family peptidase [Rhodospirillaceae bacterium]MBT5240411.1 S49 family peptidase [Rhodospirillaceae bacterium]MBT5566721.1 S49 family peptidase [Rhodospirillaceae bacterium]MBT6090772.1 S49 family peptidase [Rhodospirillaceae bacterium]MBT7449838.1 S49 family peptidase [Rhodospirillaceae bacterium]